MTGQIKRHSQALYSTLGPMRFDQVAEGFGCHGVRVERKEDLVPELRKAMGRDRPAVVHVPIVPGSPAN